MKNTKKYNIEPWFELINSIIFILNDQQNNNILKYDITWDTNSLYKIIDIK